MASTNVRSRRRRFPMRIYLPVNDRSATLSSPTFWTTFTSQIVDLSILRSLRCVNRASRIAVTPIIFRRLSLRGNCGMLRRKVDQMKDLGLLKHVNTVALYSSVYLLPLLYRRDRKIDLDKGWKRSMDCGVKKARKKEEKDEIDLDDVEINPSKFLKHIPSLSKMYDEKLTNTRFMALLQDVFDLLATSSSPLERKSMTVEIHYDLDKTNICRDRKSYFTPEVTFQKLAVEFFKQYYNTAGPSNNRVNEVTAKRKGRGNSKAGDRPQTELKNPMAIILRGGRQISTPTPKVEKKKANVDVLVDFIAESIHWRYNMRLKLRGNFNRIGELYELKQTEESVGLYDFYERVGSVQQLEERMRGLLRLGGDGKIEKKEGGRLKEWKEERERWNGLEGYTGKQKDEGGLYEKGDLTGMLAGFEIK